jgi:hypothetical protein
MIFQIEWETFFSLFSEPFPFSQYFLNLSFWLKMEFLQNVNLLEIPPISSMFTKQAEIPPI